MSKILDLNKNVYSLCREYPEVKKIMASAGFTDITKPAALHTMGRFMTIPKGAEIKEIALEKVVKAFRDAGYEVINIPGRADEKQADDDRQQAPEEKQTDESRQLEPSGNAAGNEKDGREELLKSYVRRLTEGEDLESVRADFKENFSDVSAVEIARAEQTLLAEGGKLSDVQKLCDVHSALFHGATQAEKIANAEKEVARTAAEEEIRNTVSGFDENIAAKTREYMAMQGHPLNILTLENEKISELLVRIDNKRKNGSSIAGLTPEIRKMTTIAQHYGKKDETMFPLLADKYGYPGPSDVMWGVEDEIRDSLRSVLDSPEEEGTEEKLSQALKRVKEMIYKEENILFPLCVSCFSEDEWIQIARDFPMFGACMMESMPVWDKAAAKPVEMNAASSRIELPGGSFSLKQLRAMLNILPMEITLIDEHDTNRFFNEGEKLFTRPQIALGRPVYSCHPKRIEPMVRMLIGDFKKRKRDSMHIISSKCGKKVLINYYALRDDDGEYLGTLEAVLVLDGIADAILSNKKGPVEI